MCKLCIQKIKWYREAVVSIRFPKDNLLVTIIFFLNLFVKACMFGPDRW